MLWKLKITELNIFKISLVMIFWTGTVYAQKDSTRFRSVLWESADRPFFLLVDYSTLGDFLIKTSDENKSDNNGEIEFAHHLGVKANFPIYMSSEWKVAGGVRYYLKSLVFDNDYISDPRLGNALDQEPLQRYGIRAYLIRKSWGKKMFFSRIALGVNTVSPDFTHFISDFAKLEFRFVHLLYHGHRPEFGLGLGFGYNWGKPLLLPVLYYKAYLSPRQRIKLFIPKDVAYELMISNSTKFTSQIKVSGASYSLEGNNASGYKRLEIRQSEVRAFLGLDKQIWKIVWMNIYVGMLHNIKFNVVEPETFDSDKMILKTDAFNAPYIGFRIYSVVPDAWVK